MLAGRICTWSESENALCVTGQISRSSEGVRRLGSGTTGGEFAPVEAEVHDQQRGQGEGDHADGGEDIAEVAPVTRARG